MRSTNSKLIGFGLLLLSTSTTAAGGDFNGDGKDDLAIGVPNEDVGGTSNAGAVIVIYGSPVGLRSRMASGAVINAQLIADDDTWWSGGVPESDSAFGGSLADGDFNGDGFDDLAIGAYTHTVETTVAAGQVYILYGGPMGLGGYGDMILNRADFPRQRIGYLDHFGYTLAAGDFDGDGDDDLAIGCPYVKVGGAVDAGAFFWCRGVAGESYLEPVDWIHLDQWFGAGTASMGDYFGTALGVGDFDNDGVDDLVVGASGRSHAGVVDCGAVYETHGVLWTDDGGFGLSVFASATLHVQSMFPGSGGVLQSDSGFGSSLACGDFDGNNADDVAIGAPFQDIAGVSDCGAVFCTGGTDGVGLTYGWHPDQTFEQDRFGLDTNQTRDDYGKSLTAGDFGWFVPADGGPECADLVIGCPGQKIGSHDGAGMLHVLPGDDGFGPGLGAYPAKRWHQNTAGILESAGASDRFASVLGVGDFDGNGYDDLAIGVHFEDVGTTMSGVDAGSVQVIYSHAITEPGTVGLHATGNQLWHQGSAGIPGSIGASNRFGEVLQK